MAYQSPFIRFKMNGHFGSSGTVKTEYWSCGLNIASSSVLAPGSSTLLGFLTNISTNVSAFHALTTTKAGTSCWLDTLSAALIDVNGNYAGGSAQSTTIYSYPAPVAGSGVLTAPWPTSIAWSLRSAILRGPGSHGRCFYPATAMLIDSTTGGLSLTQQNSYLATVLTLINQINSAATTSFATNTNVSNVSPVGLGFRSPVTRVGIGARLDVQESREKSVSEAYAFGNTSIALRVLEQAEREYVDNLKKLPQFGGQGAADED
jgi:hypothetical protein